MVSLTIFTVGAYKGACVSTATFNVTVVVPDVVIKLNATVSPVPNAFVIHGIIKST